MKRLIIAPLLLAACLGAVAQIVDTKYEDGKFGFVDASGNWVVSPKYDNAYWVREQGIGYYGHGDLQGVIDASGKERTKAVYAEIFCAVRNEDQEGIFTVKNEKGLQGVIDITGKWIVPCEYASASVIPNSELGAYPPDGFSMVGNKTADAPVYSISFDKQKKKVYEGYGYYYYEPAANLLTNGRKMNGSTKWGVIDTKGKSVIECKYDYIKLHDFGIVLKNAGIVSLADLSGKTIIPVTAGYTEIKDGGEGLMLVKNGADKWGYWASGKEIVPCSFDEAEAFANGVAMVIASDEARQIEHPLSGAKVSIAQGGSDPKFEKTAGGKAVSRYPAPNSDVDRDIPTAKTKNENRFAFIIANENYDDAPVPYALNDGRMFAQYCTTALGLPEQHVQMYEDATLGNIISAVSKLKTTADAYDGDAEIIFYYAGHGVPDESGDSAYLLPVDGNPSAIATTGFGLDKLYKELSAINARNVMVFIDACFSGAKREDEILTAGRGVRIKVKEEQPVGNLVVFSASTGDETAHQLAEKGHGLFTYHLLKELQSDGEVSLGDLADNVTRQVKRQSVVINHKRQTPTVIPSPGMAASWRGLKVK